MKTAVLNKIRILLIEDNHGGRTIDTGNAC